MVVKGTNSASLVIFDVLINFLHVEYTVCHGKEIYGLILSVEFEHYLHPLKVVGITTNFMVKEK